MTKPGGGVIAGTFLASDCFPNISVMRDGSFSYLDESTTSNPLSLVYCQNLHYLDLAVNNPNVSAIITTPPLASEALVGTKAIIVAANPRLAFFKLYMDFYKKGLNWPSMEFGVGQDCRIHATAIVSPRSRIGDRVEIGANVVIEDFIDIEDDVYIGPNAVIGAEGLITLRREDNSLLLVKHAGGARIGKCTQIFTGATVAKSLFRNPTRIGRNCQVGILTSIGHGVSIGDNSVISGNSIVAGRTSLGQKVWAGASVSIAQGLTIGDEAQIKMGSVVIGNVAPGQVVSGNYAVPHKANMRNFFKIGRNENI